MKGLYSSSLHAQSTVQFGDQLLGNCKGESATAFACQSAKERIHKFLRNSLGKQNAKRKKYVCVLRVMEISFTGDSIEFTSSVHLFFEAFLKDIL